MVTIFSRPFAMCFAFYVLALAHSKVGRPSSAPSSQTCPGASRSSLKPWSVSRTTEPPLPSRTPTTP